MTRIYRSETDKKIAGICGGIAEAYGMDPNLMRVGFVFLGIATGGLPLLIAYLVGWIVFPVRPRSAGERTAPPGQRA